MKVKVRDTEIYFDVAGMQLAPDRQDFVEKPVLFMLHGGPGGDHLRYKQHSFELQEHAQLVFVDFRGCGRSRKSKQREYTLENNIEDVEALRQFLGLDRICLLGTSYGGMVAQGYAIRYHKNIEKLILVATAPSYRFLDEAKKNILKIGDHKQIKACEHLWNGTFKNHKHIMNFFSVMDRVYSKSSAKNKKISFSKSRTIWSSQALNEGFGNDLKNFDYTGQLKKIKCPTLILAGENDWISSPNQSRIISKKIPNATLRVFKNCGHAIAVDCHDKYISEIRKFILAKRNKKRKR